MSLTDDFHLVMHQAIVTARSLGYPATAWTAMIERHGAVEAARRLVMSGDIQSGFKRLHKMGRLDLTVEELMLDQRFRGLFRRDEIEAAEWRLTQAKTGTLDT